MSGEKDYNTAKEELTHFLSQLDEYLGGVGVIKGEKKKDYEALEGLLLKDHSGKTRDELRELSYLMYEYAGYIQEQLSKNQVVLNWCVRELNKLAAQNSEELRHTKYELRNSKMALDNTFIGKIEQMRFVAESRVEMLKHKPYQLKQQAQLISDKARSY